MAVQPVLDLIEREEPGIVIFDCDYHVLHVNPAIFLLFPEISRDQILGNSLMDFHAVETGPKIRSLVSLMNESGRQVSTSFKVVGPSDHPRYLFMRLIPLLGGHKGCDPSCLLLYEITSLVADDERHFIRLPVSTGRETLLLPIQDVLYIQADNIYSRVFTKEGEFLCEMPLGVVEKRSPAGSFFRVHRSYLVNLEKIERIVRDDTGQSLRLSGLEGGIPLSRRRSIELRARLGLD